MTDTQIRYVICNACEGTGEVIDTEEESAAIDDHNVIDVMEDASDDDNETDEAGSLFDSVDNEDDAEDYDDTQAAEEYDSEALDEQADELLESADEGN